jgi:HAD domain in Swiss Army Knife RNA repair proteins
MTCEVDRGAAANMLTNRAALLLDVDGVLAPFGSTHAVRQRAKSPWTRTSPWELIDERWNVWLNPAMGTAIAELAHGYDAEIVWCTTWLDDPDALVAFAEFLGINALTLDIPPTFTVEPGGVAEWQIPNLDKLRVAAFAGQHYQHGCVWFDDDDWARILPPNVTLVRTEPKAGLRPDHIERAKPAFERLKLGFEQSTASDIVDH